MKKTNDNRIPTAVVHRHWLTYESLLVSFIAANLHVFLDLPVFTVDKTITGTCTRTSIRTASVCDSDFCDVTRPKPSPHPLAKFRKIAEMRDWFESRVGSCFHSLLNKLNLYQSHKAEGHAWLLQFRPLGDGRIGGDVVGGCWRFVGGRRCPN